MTQADKMTLLQAMAGAGHPDDLLPAYLLLAGEKILRRAYPYDPTVREVPSQYCALQCEIAAYLLNRRGSEGQTSHSENGVSRSYEGADVPESMLNHIVPMVGVIG